MTSFGEEGAEPCFDDFVLTDSYVPWISAAINSLSLVGMSVSLSISRDNCEKLVVFSWSSTVDVVSELPYLAMLFNLQHMCTCQYFRLLFTYFKISFVFDGLW